MNKNLENLKQKALQLFDDKNWDELMPICTEIIELEKLSRAKAFTYFRRGLAYDKKGDLDLAIADLTEALELDPSYAPAYYYRGLAYDKKGDLDQAIADLTEALELDPSYASAYFCRGLTYDKKGDFDLAIADLTEALELDPNDAPTYFCRGLVYDKKGDFDQAIADLTKALELDPSYVLAYLYRGQTHDKKGDFDQAITDFTKTLELDPNYAFAYFYRGLTYDKKGDLDQAIADSTKGLELNPSYAPAYYHRGLTYDKKGDLDQAIADFTKALELDPNHAFAYLYRALEYSRKNDLDLTIADLNKMLELKSSDSVRSGTHFFRGTVYLRKGNFLKAFDNFVDSNKYDPDLKFFYPQNYVASRIDDIYEGSEKEDKAEAFELYSKLLDSIIKIQREQFYEPGEDREVAHYTSLHTLKDLANKEEHFRFYNAAYMNDPEEGSVFFDIIEEKELEINVKKVFYEEDEDSSYQSPAYIGSFIVVDSDDQEQEQKDKLFLWRTYGKHNGHEAAGACLIFRHEGTCFAEIHQTQVGDMQRLQSKLHMLEGDLKDPRERQHSKPALYKIFYMDKETKERLSEKLKKLAESLERVGHLVFEEENDRENRLKQLARELLDNIRFLFKASHYKEEREVRVVQFCYYDEDMFQEQDEIKVDTEQIPLRFYLDAHGSFHFDEVILGPKAHGVREWTQLLKELERDIEVKKSEIKYGKQSF